VRIACVSGAGLAGIGHDKDVPLMALAADHMASTPTATATLLIAVEEARMKLSEFSSVLGRIPPARLNARRMGLDGAWSGITGPFQASVNHCGIGLSSPRGHKHNDRSGSWLLICIARIGGKIVKKDK